MSKYLAGTPEEQAQGWGSPTAAGAVKSAGRGLGTILDLISRPNMPPSYEAAYRAQNPGATSDQAQTAYQADYAKTFGGRMSQHVQDAANWLKQGSQPEGFWEHVGAVGEQALELLGTDGLLKLAGPAAQAATTGSRAVQVGSDLKNAQQVATVLQANPKLAGLVAIGGKAAQEAATQGAISAGQTYLHTQDPGQTAAAGIIGGGIGGGLSAAGGTLGLLGRKLSSIAPAAAETPAGPTLGEIAQQATGKAAENINARPAFQADIPQMTGDYTEVRPATPKIPVEGAPTTRYDLPQGGTVTAQKIKPAYTFESSNPVEARQMRGQLQDYIDSPEFKNLRAPVRQQFQDAVDQLDQQLKITGLRGQDPMQLSTSLGNITSFGDGATALRDSVSSMYDRLNQVSDGQFSNLRGTVNSALSKLKNPTITGADREAAQASLDAANSGIDDILDKAGMTGPQYQRMKTAWRYANTLDNLHSQLEGVTNTLSGAQTQAGAPSVTTGTAKNFNNWLNKMNDIGTRTNRQDVEELIGTDGINNITRLTDLMSKADTARTTTSVMKGIANQLYKDMRTAGTVGGLVGHFTGMGWATGAGLGVMAGAGVTGMRMVSRYAMQNPEVGRMISYAAENKVPSSVYAPLISRMILAPFQAEGAQP